MIVRRPERAREDSPSTAPQATHPARVLAGAAPSMGADVCEPGGAAVVRLTAETVRDRCENAIAQVYRGHPAQQLSQLAHTCLRQQSVFGVATPPDLRTQLREVERRQVLMQRLPYGPVDIAAMTRALDAFAVTALIAACAADPESPFASAIASHLEASATQPTRVHNSPELGNFQQALATWMAECCPALLDVLADTLPELHPSMPVLDATVADLMAAGERPLADANVCVLGHILGEAPAMLDALERLGAERATTFVAPVPYSSNALAIWAVERMGYDVVRAREPASQTVQFTESGFFDGIGERAIYRGIVAAWPPVRRAKPTPAAEAELRRLATHGLDFVARPPATSADVDLQMTPAGVSFAAIKDEQVERVLQKALAAHAANNKRIVVIDDGGYALAVVRKRWPEREHLFHFVEQTTRGIRRIESLGSGSAAVVDVARCLPKRVIEGPFVAEASCDAVRAHVTSLFDRIEPGTAAAVVGYGTIGAPVARELAGLGFDVSVFDSSVEAATRAAHDGFAIAASEDDAVKKKRLVIGCTGQASVSRHAYATADAGTIFGSLSSANIEFETTRWAPWGTLEVRLRTSYSSQPGLSVAGAPPKLLPYLQRTLSARHHYLRTHLEGIVPVAHAVTRGAAFDTLFILNGGFPLNLTRQLQCMPPERIQVTLACLVAGAAQKTPGQTGIVALAAADDIAQRFASLAR